MRKILDVSEGFLGTFENIKETWKQAEYYFESTVLEERAR